ncbi:MAG: trypsin-like peptidase domain-containing protein, partial [Chloroflexi bacterium]|nr:trypsin-like peptidase domain-containing protein [Chloroflexota bacterium]
MPLISTATTPLPALKWGAPASSSPIAAATAPTSAEALAAMEGALENIYTRVNPSVVSIRVVEKEQVSMPNFPDFPGFRFFFGPNAPQFPQQQQPQEQFRQGAGSGFVWDKEGHIVTNNHVVDGADKIRVTFADGTTAEAKVVGTDPDSDLAVIKVDIPAERLQPVEVADSTQVKVGQLAVAIGNPFALENTMTVGFVSALGRQLPVGVDSQEGLNTAPKPSYTIPDIIQTDAPINPGNSGGVLVNDQGQVIGVTAAIESPVRASAGIGFAIPAAIVQRVVPTLIKGGAYEHPWLGLSGISINPDLAAAMKLKSGQRGALVIDVTPGSPADKAGLRGSDRQMQVDGQDVRVGGDLITAFNGQPVQGFDDLVADLASSAQVGQTVKLTVLRDGKEETIDVSLAARPAQGTQQGQSQNEISSGVWLGIRGLDVTAQIAQALKLPADQTGVLVEQVEVNSPADVASLRGSFKPTTINGEQVT